MVKNKAIIFLAVMLFIFLSISFVFADNKNVSGNLSTQELTISPAIASILKVVFGLAQNGTLDLQKAIILCALLLIVFAVISEMIVLVPIFGEGFRPKIIGLIIALIGSVTGVLVEVYNFLFGIANMFKFPGAWQILRLVIILFILGIFWAGAHFLIKNIVKKSRREAANLSGFKLGTGI
jgi:hypothetical protein